MSGCAGEGPAVKGSAMRAPSGRRLAAMAMIVTVGCVPRVAIVTVQRQAAHGFPAGTIQHVAWPGEGCSTVVAELSGAPGFRSAFASEAEAVAFLRTAPAAAALEVIASVRYTGLDGRTLP